MKVLQYLYSLNVGGAETMFVEYLIQMKKRGIDGKLLVYFKDDNHLLRRLEENGIEVISLFKHNDHKPWHRLQRKLFVKWRTKQLLNQLDYDVLHLHMQTSNYLPRQKFAAKLFYTHHIDIPSYIDIFGDVWVDSLRYHIENNDLTSFVLSEEMKQDAERLISPKNVMYLPNSIDITAFRAQTMERSTFLQEHNLPDDAFLVGHIARIEKVKNHKKSLEILQALCQKRPHSYLVVVGKGKDSYLAELKDYAKQLGVADNVLFLGLRSDVGAVMSILDAALLPSIYEGFPLTMIEYQAKNLRCVCSYATPTEIICNDNCFRMDVEQPASAWADRLLATDVRPESQDIMQFDVQRVLDKLIAEYQK